MIKKMMYLITTLFLFAEQPLMAKELLPGTGSHFTFTVTGATVNITTNTPNHFYPNAGIKFITQGFAAAGDQVKLQADGTYLFPVSDTSAASITFLGSGGSVQFQICLNGVGKKYSCEKQTMTVGNSHIIFVTSGEYPGNLGGAAGADALCQSEAYKTGSIITTKNLKFKALLVTPMRYPCSSINGGLSGSCGGSFAKDWPLVPGTPYINPNGSIFNTVNKNGVFNGSSTKVYDQIGSDLYNGNFWSGIQSILLNADASDIVGWAYTDMNKAADGDVYTANIADCNGFTSSSNGLKGNSGRKSKGISKFGDLSPSTWGNFLYFDNSMTSAISNLFTQASFTPETCDNLFSLVCVS